MMALCKWVERYALHISLLCSCAYALSSLVVPPEIVSDAGFGFRTWDTMRQGAPFNCTTQPDPSDISKDINVFLVWWTPGQYLVPGLVEVFFGVSLGIAIVVTVLLFTILGVVGFYKLYEHFGFDRKTCSFSILFIVTSRSTSLSFSNYNGGELLLFGILPWVLLSAFAIDSKKLLWIAVVSLLGVFAFYMKSSFLISFVALLCVEIANQFRQPETNAPRAGRSTFFVLLTGSLVLGAAYLLHLRFGETPASLHSFYFDWLNLLVPASSPTTALLQADNVFDRIFRFPGSKISFVREEAFYIAMCFVNVYVLSTILTKQFGSRLYRITLVVFQVIFFLFFVTTYFLGASISYESRHFRILGLLLLPGYLELCFQMNRWTRYIGLGVLVLASCYGVSGFVNRKIHIANNNCVGQRFTSHAIIDEETLPLLTKCVKESSADAAFYVTSPEIALEMGDARIIAAHTDFQSLQSLQGKQYAGTSEQLYIVLQKGLGNEKIDVILNSFVRYDKFDIHIETKRFLCFKGIEETGHAKDIDQAEGAGVRGSKAN